MTDNELPVGLEKRVIAKECVTLLSVLPKAQVLKIRLEWLRSRDLRRLHKEIMKTLADKVIK